LPDLIDKQNTASDVWADTAYRSAKNEEHMIRNGLRSQIHRKKPKGKPMPEAIARANGKKSKVRARLARPIFIVALSVASAAPSGLPMGVAG